MRDNKIKRKFMQLETNLSFIVKSRARYVNTSMTQLLLPRLLIFFLSCSPTVSFSQSGNMAVTNITVFTEPNKPPIENATILISKGKFRQIGKTEHVAIPKGYSIINGAGKFATAGFWNSHVHFMEPKWNDALTVSKDTLEAHMREMFTSKGFVYVFDLAQINFNYFNLLTERIRKEKLRSPTILMVGVPFASRSPFYIDPVRIPELKTEEEVEDHVISLIDKGANGIKLWSASPTGSSIDYLSAKLIRAAATIANERHIPLFAHPTNLKGVEIAVENGVGVLAHVAADDRLVWDSMLVQKMIANNVAVIPTLKLHLWDMRRTGAGKIDNSLIETARQQLAVFNKAGGVVLFGTDVGFMDDYDIEEELTQMRDAGMGFDEILAAMTVNPANKFNQAKRTGTISVGKNADLVILDANPASDIKNFTAVNMTFHNGRVIFER